jgi:hypothetical protein
MFYVLSGERSAVLPRREDGKGDGEPGHAEAGGGDARLRHPRQEELQLSHPRPGRPAQVHRSHHVHSYSGIRAFFSLANAWHNFPAVFLVNSGKNSAADLSGCSNFLGGLLRYCGPTPELQNKIRDIP